jgi:hypothetical protein
MLIPFREGTPERIEALKTNVPNPSLRIPQKQSSVLREEGSGK